MQKLPAGERSDLNPAYELLSRTIDSTIALQDLWCRRNSAHDPTGVAYGWPFEYVLQFRTIKFGVGRQIGVTQYIVDHYDPFRNDMYIGLTKSGCDHFMSRVLNRIYTDSDSVDMDAARRAIRMFTGEEISHTNASRGQFSPLHHPASIIWIDDASTHRIVECSLGRGHLTRTAAELFITQPSQRIICFN